MRQLALWLSPIQLDVMLRKFGFTSPGGLTHAEIAAELGLERATVKMHALTAAAILRTHPELLDLLHSTRQDEQSYGQRHTTSHE